MKSAFRLSIILSLTAFGCSEKYHRNEVTMAPASYSEKTPLDSLILSTCDCADETFPYLDCDTTFLSNNSMIFWYYDCDSATLCFENDGLVNILKSGSSYGLISSLGLAFIKEYDEYLYCIEEHISGCCAPPDIVLLDKNDASEIYRVYADLYVFASIEKDYVLHFINDDFEELVFYDLAKNKKQQFSLKNSEVRRIANEIKPIHIRDLFTISNYRPGYLEIDLKTGIVSFEKIKIKVK